MIKPTITDAGVLVALIYERDRWHQWANEQAKNLQAPFLTCESVIAEAAHLLKPVRKGQESLLAFVAQGFVQIKFSLSAEVPAVQALMQKYSDVPMDLADACLVRMSEQIENSMIFTLDSDFWVYRKYGKEQIPLIIPDRNA